MKTKKKKQKDYAVVLHIFFSAGTDKEARARAEDIASANTGMGLESDTISLADITNGAERLLKSRMCDTCNRFMVYYTETKKGKRAYYCDNCET